MQLIRRLTILLALALAASTLPAQDEADEAAAPGGADEQTEAPADPAPGDVAGDAEGDDAERDDDDDAPEAGEDEVFVPTEELSAEDEVTFPVGI